MSVEHRRGASSSRLVGGMAISAVVVLVAVGVLAYLIASLLADEGSGAGDGERSTPGSVRIVKVVDGDTIEVDVAGRHERVRLIGIDTPETKDPRTPVECFGAEASARAAELLPPGTEVRLVSDVEERDRYDRVLAYVYRLPDELFVNLALARDGFADLLTIPPNVAHTDELRAAVSDARREQRGLWPACGGIDTPVP
ncbi:MAG TPA: thermonuclease family protein [Acidimicrobiales bacterium]